jgi:hypothetical protein
MTKKHGTSFLKEEKMAANFLSFATIKFGNTEETPELSPTVATSTTTSTTIVREEEAIAFPEGGGRSVDLSADSSTAVSAALHELTLLDSSTSLI